MTRQLIAKAPESSINALTATITGIDTDALIEEVRQLGTQYGLQKNHCETLEHKRKSCIALLMENHREEQNKQGNSKPTAQQLDNLARGSEEYEKFLDILESEKNNLVHIQEMYFSKRNKLDMLLEQMKLARAEMHYLQQSSQTL